VVEVDGEVLAARDGAGAVVAVEMDVRRPLQGPEGIAEGLDDALRAVAELVQAPEVEVEVSVTVARSQDEAERINRGEDISTRNEDRDAAAEAIAAAGEFFDPEAQQDDEPAPAADETEK